MDVRPPALAVGLLMLFAAASDAGPLVPGAPEPISRTIAAARAAVLAVPDERPTGWRVTDVLVDPDSRLLAGSLVLAAAPRPPEATAALIIAPVDGGVILTALSPEAATYIRGLPKPSDSPQARIAYAAPRLDAPDPLVAVDAFAELAAADLADLRAHRALLPVERLREAVESPGTPADRLGLCGLLLGLCGDSEDAGRLRQRFGEGTDLCVGEAGLAAGYLLLVGDDAVADIEANVLLGDGPPLKVSALLDAFALLRSDPGSPIVAERLRHAACAAMIRPEVADLAVGHLASLSEWRAAPEVTALLRQSDPTHDAGRAAQVAAVRFLDACRSAPDAAEADRAAAAAALDRLAVSDPDLLRRAARLAAESGPTRR